MEQDRILEYLLKNEASRYEADKEKHRTWRQVLVAYRFLNDKDAPHDKVKQYARGMNM